MTLQAHPNEETAAALDAIRDRLKVLDTECGLTHDAARMLARDYRAWLSGEWAPTAARAGEVLAGRLMDTVAAAQEGGWHDMARALLDALWPEEKTT